MLKATSHPVAIEVDELTKNFRLISDRPESIKSMLVRFAAGKGYQSTKKEFTALRDVSFKIFNGEFVGIMGRNGAGKSTLLRLISGIYQPTLGKVSINGTVAPLIELGAGFNPDLSGYENIFLNAAILGFGRKATEEAVPSILEFAELGDFIFSPVKNFSSGMLVRLGFAIATHLPAPILLIDEILAVGDIGFQQKCIKKVCELHQSGRTIVLITHDPGAVAQYCNRCIVIDNQLKVFDGPAQDGVLVYKKLVNSI